MIYEEDEARDAVIPEVGLEQPTFYEELDYERADDEPKLSYAKDPDDQLDF